MAGVKVVTRKMVPFHGEDEEFSNVYYFGNGPTGGQINGEAVVREVIEAERAIFSNFVRFLGGSSQPLGIDNDPNTSIDPDSVEMPVGTMGNLVSQTLIYRECAVDIKFPLGGRRYLRSLLHTCHAHNLDQQGVTKAGDRGAADPLRIFADKMANGTFGGCTRMAPNGDRPQGFFINPYLEHRQFHRYRRRSSGLFG